MTPQTVKDVLDSCFLAKKMVELLPALPPGIKPRHIHVIDAVLVQYKMRGASKVGDVSRALGITMPSVTKLINELVAARLLEKFFDVTDKRAVLLRLTSKGFAYHRRYVEDFHRELAEAFAAVDERDCVTMVRTLRTVYEAMQSYLLKKETEEKFETNT